MTDREFDFTIFGATGYTGNYVFRNLILWQDIEKVPRKVAIAGRNKAKLESLVKEVSLQLDRNLEHIGVIVADAGDEQSLLSMCERSKVILNACGPYILYGEPVVKACLQKKTNMVDISGEPQYLEGMQIKYHEEARKAGIYIIGSCGYDAIPAEIGVDALKQKFEPGRLNSVEGFVQAKVGKEGMATNHGTLDSLIEAFSNYGQIVETRRKLHREFFKKKLPTPNYPLKQKFLPWKNNELNGWCLPVPLGDRDIVENSQRWFYETKDEKPAQFAEYMMVPKLFHAILITIGFLYISFMVFFSCTRKLVLKYPKIFTFGFFTKEGPTRKQLEETSFTMQLIGKGWSRPSETGEYDSPPDKTMSCLVSGPDPGYEATSRCLIQAGLTILQESDKMPFEGGVITPAFAFRHTSIRDRLTRHAVTYEVIG